MASVELASVESKAVEIDLSEPQPAHESKDEPLTAQANNKWANIMSGKDKPLPAEASPYECCVKPTCDRCCYCCCFDTTTNMRKALCFFVWAFFVFLVIIIGCGFVAGYGATQFFMLRRQICAQNNPKLEKSDGINTFASWHPMKSSGEVHHIAITPDPAHPQTFPSYKYTVPAGAFTDVSFKTADNVRINATWVGTTPCAPTVVMLHGNSVCNDKFEVTLPSAWLYKAGYNVLAIDMRNHGASEHTKMKRSRLRVVTWGAKEKLDAAAAIDWLVTTKNIPKSRIGIFGVSMGGAVAQFAALADTDINAVWVDTPACDVKMVMEHNIGNTLSLLNLSRSDWADWSTAIYLNAMVDPEFRQTAKDHLSVWKNTTGYKNHQHVHYTSMTGDLTIPPSVVETCYKEALLSEAGIRGQVTYRAFDDLKDFNSHKPTGLYTKDEIDTHVMAMLYYTDEYEKAFVDFYTKALHTEYMQKTAQAAVGGLSDPQCLASMPTNGENYYPKW